MPIAPLHVPPARHSPARAAVVCRAGGGGVGSLVAVGRPGDDVRLVLRRRLAPARPPASTPSEWIVARGGGLEGSVQRRLVEWWSAEASERPVVVDDGCDVRAGAAHVSEDARRALLRWLPLSHRELVVLEAGVLRGDPACAVGLLVRPPTVWPLAAARAGASRHPRGPSFESSRFAALEEHACSVVGSRHVARLRQAALRIVAQLPFARLPAATDTVAAGCAVLLEDDERAAAVAATLLARYAWSGIVADP
jgi:hypothetical protein